MKPAITYWAVLMAIWANDIMRGAEMWSRSFWGGGIMFAASFLLFVLASQTNVKAK